MASSDPLLGLLGATAQGNQQAFSDLYQQTAPRLYAVVLKMLPRKDWADEVLQDSYLKIWQHAGDYHADKGSVLNWMISVCRYRAIDLLRHQKVRKEVSADYEQLPGDAAGEPDQIPERLDLCLEQLDDNQRHSIFLAYFFGLSHREIVDRLRQPLGTVKSWIRRGLLVLRRCLER